MRTNPRRSWIASGLLVLAGVTLAVSGAAGDLSIPVGVLLLVFGMAVYAVAPMRYGQRSHGPPLSPPSASSAPPAPSRADIAAGDASED